MPGPVSGNFLVLSGIDLMISQSIGMKYCFKRSTFQDTDELSMKATT
jgi:hypothetical protein